MSPMVLPLGAINFASHGRVGGVGLRIEQAGLNVNFRRPSGTLFLNRL